jgi:hypothetical protein
MPRNDTANNTAAQAATSSNDTTNIDTRERKTRNNTKVTSAPTPQKQDAPVADKLPTQTRQTNNRNNRATDKSKGANAAFTVPAAAAPVEDIDALTQQLKGMKVHYNRRGKQIPVDANGNPLTPCPNCNQVGHWRAQCPYAARPVFQ